MKKTLVLAAVAALMLSACGGGAKNEQKVAAGDSAATAEIEQQAPTLPVYTLTRDSIGPVKVGMRVDELPQAVPDLYDVSLTTETPDAMAYTYLLADVPQFTIYDFMEGKVDVIALEGNARAVATPNGELRVGDSFDNVLKLPGVESEFQSFDAEGIWYWKWQGLYFGVDETDIPQELAEALCDGKRPPRAALLNSAVKIGYIATGLPF